MKKLLLFAFLFSGLIASAQHNGEGYAPKVYSYGNWFNRARFDSALHIPNKTIITSDLDTTPQLFVAFDTLRLFANGTFRNINSGVGGSTYTADESTLHLTGSVFSIKNTYPGQPTINILGTVTTGIWNSTAIADAYIASSATWNGKLGAALASGHLFVGNGSNIATDVALSGDATLSNTGALTLASTISAGSCTSCNLTYDAKGRITVAANGSAGSAPFADNSAIIKNNADNTRLLIISAANVPTATTRTLTAQNGNYTLAGTNIAQTFSLAQTFTLAPNFTSSSTTGYVWTASDNAGNGGWASNPAGMNQLTGDGTAGPGTGSQALTLATVNSNTGTFGDATHIPVVTTNGKGLITAISTVVASGGGGGGSFAYTVATAVNTANYTVTTSNFIILPDLTGQANRNIVLPTSPASGTILTVKNNNTIGSSFNWTFTNGTAKNYINATITTLSTQTVYDLVFDGTNWDIKN